MWGIKKLKRKEEVILPINEFKDKSDIKRIMNYLNIRKSKLIFKVLLSCVCTLLLLTVGILLNLRIDIVSNLGVFSNLYLYLIINILSVLILIMLKFRDISKGLINIIKFRPNSDSIILLCAVGSVVQSIFVFFVTNEIMAGKLSLYTSIFGLSVLLDFIGKFYNESRIKKNFKFLISSTNKFSIRKIEGKKNLEQKFEVPMSKSAVAVVQDKVEKINNFIKLSYMPNSNDYIINKIAVLNIVSIIIGFIVDVIIEKSFVSAVQAFTLLSCLCAPISNIFIINKCLWKSSRNLTKNKAVLIGYDAVNKVKGITHIVFDASQIYPKGCVTIKGVRAFGEQHIDDVILNAAAVTNSLSSTLNGVFEKAFSSKRIVIPKASNVEYEDFMGLVGWVNGKRILVGNRELLKKYKVYPPSQVFEHKCCTKGQHAVYVAIHHNLAAMFIISYKVNKEIVKDLQEIVKNGVKLLISTSDCCITAESVSDCFGIPDNTIQIINNVRLNGHTESNQFDSIITCGKDIKSFFCGVLSCIKLRYVVSVISAIEICACAIGLVATMILILSRGILQVGTVEFLIFTVFWQISMYGGSYICGT